MFRSIQHTVNCNEESYEICSILYDWFLKWTMIQFLRQFLFKILLLFAEKIRSLVRDTRAKNRVLWKSLCDQKILIGGCRACFSDLSQISQIITDKKMFLKKGKFWFTASNRRFPRFFFVITSLQDGWQGKLREQKTWEGEIVSHWRLHGP